MTEQDRHVGEKSELQRHAHGTTLKNSLVSGCESEHFARRTQDANSVSLALQYVLLVKRSVRVWMQKS